MAAYKQSMTPILVAILALAALSIIAVVAITALRPDTDNTNLMANVMSILLPSALALLAFLKSFENSNAIHGSAEAVEETKVIAKESKVLVEENKAIVEESKVLVEESKAISQENKAELKVVHGLVDGRMDAVIQQLVEAAHAMAISEGANAAIETFHMELEKVSKTRASTKTDMENAVDKTVKEE